MSRREKEKEESLAALRKIAFSVSGGAPAPPSAAPARQSSLPPAKPKAPPAPPKPPAKAPANLAAERDRLRRLEERKAKLEEERMLKERRQNELHRNKNLEWRGMGGMDHVPASIRRTAFDRQEPSLLTKIDDVLGPAREKEGRAKNRDKGRRQGGK